MTPENNFDSNSEIAALKNQVFSLLIALIVVSGTVTVYLFREASLVGKDLEQAEKLDPVVDQNDNALKNFVNTLAAYGEKHPDFLPLLKKYGIVPVPQTPAGTAPAK